MAYEIEKVDVGNVDTPLTKFPVSIDTFPRKSDVTISMLPLVLQYNNYYQSGNISAANQLIEANPELEYCLFNAKGHNEIRDAIIAIEYYLLNQVETFYNEIASDTEALYNQISEHAEEVAKNAIGINDNPEEGSANVVAYSAQKVDSLISDVESDIESISNKFSNVDNTADADKNVKYATSAGNASTADTLNGLTTDITELNYVDGVTSNIQTQLNGKQASINGAASTITGSNLTTNRALISNGSGKVAVSDVTSTELGYLDGVTSNIQTQLNNKAVSGHTHDYAPSSHNQGAGTITEGTLAGKILANASAVATLGNKQVRNIFAGTTAATAGSAFSGLSNGDIYFQYEVG